MASGKIYVSIASYRDDYLQSTIDNALITAHDPALIYFGCFVQLLDEDFFTNTRRVRDTHAGKVFYEEAEAGEVFSVSACRTRANQWLTEEYDYVLQVDSHTRFTPGWDLSLKTWIKSCPANSLFSSYVPGWVPLGDGTEELNPDFEQGCQEATFNDEVAKGSFMRTYDLVPNLVHRRKADDAVYESWYLCGHFIFGPSTYFLEVAQPSWILFWGEELYHGLLAASYGWRVFIPPKLPIRHLYPQDVQSNIGSKLWVDFNARWAAEHDPATDRVLDAIISKKTGKDYFKDVGLVENLYRRIGYDIGKLLEEWQNERKALH